jgi:polyisoprenoid-binding protein YceI
VTGKIGGHLELQSISKQLPRLKRVSLALVAVAGLALAGGASSDANAETWKIDPVHSNVSFSVKHMMISQVKGEFDKFSGTISATGTDPASVKIEATIDAASVNTRAEKRDAHLKSPDFLDVAKYPTITFKSTKIEAAGAGKWKVTGDLTLHGVTKPVVLEVTGPSEAIKGPNGKPRRGASASTTINRQDFGVAFNKTLDSGGLMVGYDVAISIDVEASEE